MWDYWNLRVCVYTRSKTISIKRRLNGLVEMVVYIKLCMHMHNVRVAFTYTDVIMYSEYMVWLNNDSIVWSLALVCMSSSSAKSTAAGRRTVKFICHLLYAKESKIMEMHYSRMREFRRERVDGKLSAVCVFFFISRVHENSFFFFFFLDPKWNPFAERRQRTL